MSAARSDRAERERSLSGWSGCRFLTASILPVRAACELACPFCFSKSSVSTLQRDERDWRVGGVERYLEWAREAGATRLVITGGGEPLLRAETVVDLVRRGRRFFDEIACFTNGTHLTRDLSRALSDAGLSYLCWSRHAVDDDDARRLMGPRAPSMEGFFASKGDLTIRATCVMTRGQVDRPEEVWRYVARMKAFGVTEFTFKHTYVAYERSVFKGSGEDVWAEANRIERDPFAGRGEVLFALPWGPEVRRIDGVQVCFYREPTPAWEKEHRLCRSANLLADGKVYASLEDEQSLLFELPI
jgi:MoaA/NifB/PqqE/SkfB family radical SAM enzyme